MAENKQFERDKICYVQNCEHMRSLVQIMWQVPMLAMTLTGGLWYAVATMKGMDPNARSALLVFSAIANGGLILMINRVRNVIAAYLKRIKSFNPTSHADATDPEKSFFVFRDRGVCRTFSMLMGVGAAFSLVGAYLILMGNWNLNPC
jgi:hypothetical protein